MTLARKTHQNAKWETKKSLGFQLGVEVLSSSQDAKLVANGGGFSLEMPQWSRGFPASGRTPGFPSKVWGHPCFFGEFRMFHEAKKNLGGFTCQGPKKWMEDGKKQ